MSPWTPFLVSNIAKSRRGLVVASRCSPGLNFIRNSHSACGLSRDVFTWKTSKGTIEPAKVLCNAVSGSASVLPPLKSPENTPAEFGRWMSSLKLSNTPCVTSIQQRSRGAGGLHPFLASDRFHAWQKKTFIYKRCARALGCGKDPGTH